MRRKNVDRIEVLQGSNFEHRDMLRAKTVGMLVGLGLTCSRRNSRTTLQLALLGLALAFGYGCLRIVYPEFYAWTAFFFAVATGNWVSAATLWALCYLNSRTRVSFEMYVWRLDSCVNIFHRTLASFETPT
jgi:hypothetical protein